MSVGTLQAVSRPIVVGVDGSDGSKAALAWAAAQAELTRSRLVAVSVLPNTPSAHPLSDLLPRSWYLPPTPYGVAETDSRRWYAAARSRLESTLREVLGESRSGRVALQVVRGHPSRVLASLSLEASLVVVGSRGRSSYVSLILGSASDYLTAHAACPVVVIRLESARRAA